MYIYIYRLYNIIYTVGSFLKLGYPQIMEFNRIYTILVIETHGDDWGSKMGCPVTDVKQSAAQVSRSTHQNWPRFLWKYP